MLPTTNQPTTPPKIKDSKNREWTISLNIGLCEQIRDACGINFAQLDEGRVFLELGNDPFKLGATLWLLCEKQAIARQIDVMNFKEGFDGDVVSEAVEAIAEAVILFTRAALRGPLRKVFAAMRKAQDAQANTVATWTEENAETIATAATAETSSALETLKQQLSASLPS